MSTIIPPERPIPTRAELRDALYAHTQAEKAWHEQIAAEYRSLLLSTPRPETDVVELATACSAAYAALLDIADRLPEGVAR